jgi:ClpP class serine protease
MTLSTEKTIPQKPRVGVLAVQAGYWGYPAIAAEQNVDIRSGVELVQIEGYLSSWSYPRIRDRVRAALGGSAKAVILICDSPGGDLTLALETAMGIRADADAAGKPLYGYVTGSACSSCYGLISSCDKIFLGPSTLVGSIGLLECRVDASDAEAMSGVRVWCISTGSKKAYGNPSVPMSETELADSQRLLLELAQPFFQLVADRRGISIDVIASYEADVFTGVTAIAKGLADGQTTLDRLISSLSTGEYIMDFEALKASLEADSVSDNAEVAARAKRMLAAVAAPKTDDDKEGAALEEPVKNDTEDNDSGDTSDEEDDAKKKAASKVAAKASKRITASTSSSDTDANTALAETVQNLSAKMQAMEQAAEKAERTKLLQGQSKEIQAALANKPLDTVRAVVQAVNKVNPQAVTTVKHTQAAKAEPTDAASTVPKSVSDQIARKMRIQPKEKVGFKEIKMAESGRIFYFSVPASYDPRKSTKDAG